MKAVNRTETLDPKRELNEFRGDTGAVGKGDPIFNDYRGMGGGGGYFPLSNDFRVKGTKEGEVIIAQKRFQPS